MPRQSVHKSSNENAGQSDPTGDVQELNSWIFRMKDGDREPAKIEPLHNEQPTRHQDHEGFAAFYGPWQEKKERENKMEDQEDGAVHLPAMFESV